LFGETEVLSISESRLLSRVHEARTSQRAMPLDFSIWILDA